MTYVLETPNGTVWKIEDGAGGDRWGLYYSRNGARRKIASYISPGAAALAVANGDTGVHEWDDAPRDPAQFTLRHWQRIPLPQSA